ncbi:uncharacterized protein LOC110454083 [Mizuhopecten yessoensis]|uniref:uncharacterized protein LOC110454083 n=1 Tax=Mizuhopecten yessoensis TaxID=6573 RepID=UPI000B45F4EC|nr:uncharacterized protein LOC110454083 [Mizuhopecten yessoensis]
MSPLYPFLIQVQLSAIQDLLYPRTLEVTLITKLRVKCPVTVKERMTGLKKKLVALSKERDCAELHGWIKSILNHLYWVASSTPDSNRDMMLQKWASVGNHIQNVHHGHGSLFPACSHLPLDPSRRNKKWLKPATKVNEKLGLILSSTYLKRDIPMLSSGQQTSHLEAYHSVINHFAPKMIGFSYHGMQSRLLLAALHFNENVSREQASLPNGEKRFRITFPKQKNGDYTVRQVRTECTFNYVEDLMKATKQRVKLLQIPNCEVVGESPPPLCMNFVHPEKSEAVSGLMSRFRH